jgi:hypothetical protein
MGLTLVLVVLAAAVGAPLRYVVDQAIQHRWPAAFPGPGSCPPLTATPAWSSTTTRGHAAGPAFPDSGRPAGPESVLVRPYYV